MCWLAGVRDSYAQAFQIGFGELQHTNGDCSSYISKTPAPNTVPSFSSVPSFLIKLKWVFVTTDTQPSSKSKDPEVRGRAFECQLSQLSSLLSDLEWLFSEFQ